MKLMTQEIIDKMPKLRETEHEEDPIAHVKFFHALSNYTVYMTEYDPNQKLGFGLVVGSSVELGYISLEELEAVIVGGLKIERDLWYKPEYLSTIRAREQQPRG